MFKVKIKKLFSIWLLIMLIYSTFNLERQYRYKHEYMLNKKLRISYINMKVVFRSLLSVSTQLHGSLYNAY